MALFKKAGEALPVPMSVTFTADADKIAAERAAIEPQIAEKEDAIDALALLAEREDPDALDTIATLESEIADLRKAIRRKEHAERQLRAMAAVELGREQWHRDQHLRKKMAGRSNARLAPAKGIGHAVRKLCGHIKELESANAAMHTAWSSNWPSQADALTYPDTVRKMIGHEIYLVCRELGVPFPEVKYQIDVDKWPAGGITEAFKLAHQRTKDMLLAPEAPLAEVMEPQPPVAIVTSEPVSETPQILTGRAWQDLSDHAARMNQPQVADGKDFDVFNI